MNNKIVCLSEKEIDEIRERAEKDKEVFLAEIDGAIICSEEDYVHEMSKVFKFPVRLPKMSIGWYNDYINDLMWIKQKSIVLIIKNYDSMLENNLKLKKSIMDDFVEIILPWWEGEIVGHMVGGTPKKFMVYLEHSSGSNS